MPYGFRLSPFLIASSGIPFNITTGQDLYGDAQFNARPAFGTCGAGAATGNIQTAFGCFNAQPQAGQALIPMNYGTSPGRFTMNLRLSKTFGFGQKKEAVAAVAALAAEAAAFGRGGGGGRRPWRRSWDVWRRTPSNSRYNLTFSVSARNIFNNVNYGSPIGNLSSPLFGEANSLAPAAVFLCSDGEPPGRFASTVHVLNLRAYFCGARAWDRVICPVDTMKKRQQENSGRRRGGAASGSQFRHCARGHARNR